MTEIRDGSARRVVAQALPARDAMAIGVDRAHAGTAQASAPVTPIIVAAHLPAGPGDAGRTRLVLGAFSQPWPGVLRVTDAATGAPILSLPRPAAIGVTLAPLEAGPLNLWDRGGALEVELGLGHLADAGDLAALGGGNRIAVENDAGQWEVIGFAGAELVAPGRYRLTRLLRGLEGSDAALGPVSAGRRVMVLDARVATLPVEDSQIGESRDIRCFAGAMDVTGQDLSLAPGLHPALPLAPAHIRTTRRGDGSIAINWVRRSRGDGDGWGVVEPTLEHIPEQWLVRIFDGTSLVRSVASGTASAIYEPGEQAADFGGPAPGFSVSVAQISPVLGTGHAAWGAFND